MNESPKRFGTVDGVFTPSILTIIGVILYLRLGWVVGSTGIFGALIIICLAHVATVTTGLAMSSMTTNVRIGDGGFYSLISRSLGLEVGGAIGISLYISQTLSVALYTVGFTEAWVGLFPGHQPRVVSSIMLAVIVFLSFVNAKIAIRFQYVIMAVIVFSLISFFIGSSADYVRPAVTAVPGKAAFWTVFAVFFPAVTGISAGAALSGELKNPRRNIPRGTMTAICIGLVIYIAAAFRFHLGAETASLQADNLIILKLSRWEWAVFAGMMGATLSSAIGSILGAPRILMALAQDKVIPFARIWQKRSRIGEPRYSLLFTALVVELCILLGDLNSIAPLLTMFFLITYGMINLAVFIEKTVGITAFRPSIQVPGIILLIGGIWCFAIMFLINSGFAVTAFLIIAVFYTVQVQRGLHAPWGDIRSAMFIAISEWAAKTSARMPQTKRNWKPNLMIPVEDPGEWQSLMEFIKDIVFPKGTLRVFSIVSVKDDMSAKASYIASIFFQRKQNTLPVANHTTRNELELKLDRLIAPVKSAGIFTASMVVEAPGFLEGLHTVTQVMKGMFFPPNIMFLTMGTDREKDRRFEHLMAMSIEEKLGLVVLGRHPQRGFGRKKTINLWIRDKSPNQNLATLLTLELHKAWEKLRLVRVTPQEDYRQAEFADLQRIVEEARLPARLEMEVLVGSFFDVVARPPAADINIFGISGKMDVAAMHRIVEATDTFCMFARDSGAEDSLV